MTDTDEAQERVEDWTPFERAMIQEKGPLYELWYAARSTHRMSTERATTLARRLRARQREEGLLPHVMERATEHEEKAARETSDIHSRRYHAARAEAYTEVASFLRDATPQREGEREPVAWRYRWPEERGWRFICDRNRLPPQVDAQLYGGKKVAEVQPLYTEPPAESEEESSK